MPAPHRKSPNRRRELRERVTVLVQQRLGAAVICQRCGANLGTYADRCSADLLERCPGFNAIELQTQRAEREVGL